MTTVSAKLLVQRAQSKDCKSKFFLLRCCEWSVCLGQGARKNFVLICVAGRVLNPLENWMSPTGTNKVTVSPPERERGTVPDAGPALRFWWPRATLKIEAPYNICTSVIACISLDVKLRIVT